ncbi:MAG: aminomethyltransferase family protein, partial [Sinobacteraceae bacterium]|nr:aminomethyltransferase family protein [Nevskiaceae bacterium]
LTVTREAHDRFLVVSACATQTRDFHWLQAHIPKEARVIAVDVSSAFVVLGIMGPHSRGLLAALTDADLSNGAFPLYRSRIIDLGYARVRASRISYVGELGWELYIPSEFSQSVYDDIVRTGAKHGLVHAGYHAMNSLRVEKGYRHWGHDVSPEDTPLEAGLGFSVGWTKRDGFIGHAALLAQKQRGLQRRLMAFRLSADAPLVYHNEPIWRDGKVVGRLTSGMFGHTLGAPLGLGYVSRGELIASPEWLTAGRYEIEIAASRFPAEASLRPFYDPTSERMKS